MDDSLRLALTVVQALCSLSLIIVVILQTGKSAGLSGAIGGGAGDTFLSKNRAKTLDAKLAKLTKWLAFLFMALTVTLSLF
ncbi:MAG: preprotein translocase subunit SecG [Eubacteriales bacterium]